MTMKKNPLPILAAHCGVTIPHIRHLFKGSTPIETLHSVFSRTHITDDLWEKLRDITMHEWGRSKDHAVRRQLWQCYWDTKPHVFHVLVYRLNKSCTELAAASGRRLKGPRRTGPGVDPKTKLSVRQIDKDLHRPRILQTHLQSIAPYAMELHASMASPKTWDGVDPRHMELYRALRDPDRIRPYADLSD